MGALDRLRAAALDAAASVADRLDTPADDALVSRVGETAAGAALGRGVRSAGRAAGRLPLLSAPMDLFGTRNGVDALVAAVQADPEGVLPHLWLGEALQSMQADTRRFEQVRAVVATLNPASFVFRAAVRTAAQLGAAPATDPAAQVLARCRHLAASALRSDPRDAVALYALARVALATGRPDLAVTPAKLAVAATPGPQTPCAGPAGRGQSLAVLARAYLALGKDASAANVARKAVEAGCSLGWAVLAELAGRGPEGRRAAAELRARVSDADRRVHHGAYRTPAEVGRAVWAAQGRRTRELGDSAQGAAHRIPAYNARARTVRITLPDRP